jgi:hypothetical protein
MATSIDARDRAARAGIARRTFLARNTLPGGRTVWAHRALRSLTILSRRAVEEPGENLGKGSLVLGRKGLVTGQTNVQRYLWARILHSASLVDQVGTTIPLSVGATT